MELLVAFSTDDGRKFNNDHFGMAKTFLIFKFSNGTERLVGEIKNVKYQEDETFKHGDPGKAQSVASVLKDVDVVVGRRMGPNIVRLLEKYVCVVAKTEAIHDAVRLIHANMERIVEEKVNGGNRKHIVLKP